MNERRKYERYPLVVGSDIDSDEPKVRFGLTQDLSRNGARLLTLTQYAVGSRLALKIFISEKQDAECSVEVVRCIKVENRGIWRHEIAVEMIDLLDDEVVTTLLETTSQDS
jgi:PilZ domain